MRTKFSGMLTLLLAFVVQLTFAQEKTITGSVSDDSGLPLPGVNVLVKNTQLGTQTDFDGNYSIEADPSQTLIFSYQGFKKKEVRVGNQSVINVKMETDIATLREVVVTGFSSKTRDEITSSIVNVTSEDLSKLNPVTTVDNMLQGISPGVTVTAQNGKPGQRAFVNVRGITSINAGTEPLYIVDGARISPNDINAINPSDIESMSVLKDAASASIYGAAAANGVIVITTKRGNQGGKAKFTLSTRYGFGKRIEDNFEMMNAAQKLQYESELGLGTGANINDQAEYDRLIGRGHDWEEDLLRDAEITSYLFSALGGEEKFQYYMSLGYDENTGIIEDTEGFERVTLRVNTDYQATDWMKIGSSFGLATSSDNEPRDRNNVQNPFRGFYDYLPYDPVFLLDDDNNIIFDSNGNPEYSFTSQGFNVLEALNTNKEFIYNNRLQGNIYATATLYEGLDFTTRFAGAYDQNRRTYFIEPGSQLDFYVGDPNAPGIKTDNGSFNWRSTFTNVLTYSKLFGEVHDVNATVLSEYVYDNIKTYSAQSRGYVEGGPAVQDVASEALDTGSNEFERSTFGVALNLEYAYDSKYILTGTVRRDGDSRFGPGNRYGTFWAASAAWNISNEDFLEDSELLSNLRLRGSVGTTGNNQIGRYEWQTLYGYDSYNNVTSQYPVQAGDPNLSWEETFNLGVGLEFGLFSNRVRGVVDYYKRTTTDLLFDVPNSLVLGLPNGGLITRNIGEMENSGIEVELSADIIKNENFRWTVGGNISFYENEITKLPDGQDIIVGNNILREGEELYTFYITKYAGVNPANGDALYLDENDQVTTDFTGVQALEGKSPLPEFDGGFNTSLNYKGFELSANFYYRHGNYILNFMEANMLTDGYSTNRNQRVDAFNYWREPGDINVLPRPNALGMPGSNSDVTSDRFLQRGDFIRLRNLQIGYNVPSEFLEKTFLQGLRAYVSGVNLWTYRPYYKGDPEVGIGSAESSAPGTQGFIQGAFSLYSYPNTAQYILGFDINF